MSVISFTIKKNENPATIYVRLTGGIIAGQFTKKGLPKKLDIVSATKYRIDPKEWNSEKQRMRNTRNFDNKEINDYLTDIEPEIRRHYEKSIGNTPITSKWLKSFLMPSQGNEVFSGRLADYVDLYIDEKKRERKARGKESDSYDKKLTTLKNKIELFESHTGEKVFLKYIDKSFLEQFTSFSTERKYSHNTFARDVLHIKTLCAHARKNGYDVNVYADHLKAGYTVSDSVYLSPSELTTLRNMKGLSERLDNARKWLLISCYCGQRVSDFLKFKKSMISQETDENGELLHMITFVQVKTGKRMSIALHPVITEILSGNDWNFPKEVTEQQYNTAIKDLCKDAGFNSPVQGSKMIEVSKDAEGNKIFRKTSATFEKWELVTSHIGRRSFATNHYGKMPTPYIMAITGHATEKEFMKYIKVGSGDLTKIAYKFFQ